MAIPSGSGSEVLKRTTVDGFWNSTTAFRWDGTMATPGTSTYTVPAHHIITVISIKFLERDGENDHNFRLIANNGSSDIWLLCNQNMNANETFVWNDKIVLTAGDKLQVLMGSSNGTMDAYCSYIDQDWS